MTQQFVGATLYGIIKKHLFQKTWFELDISFSFFEPTWWLVSDEPDVASPPITHQASRPTPQLLPTIHRWQPQISGKLGTISISPQSCPVGVNFGLMAPGKPVQLGPVSGMGHFSREGTLSHFTQSNLTASLIFLQDTEKKIGGSGTSIFPSQGFGFNLKTTKVNQTRVQVI